jgi:hypothetical protein
MFYLTVAISSAVVSRVTVAASYALIPISEQAADNQTCQIKTYQEHSGIRWFRKSDNVMLLYLKSFHLG